MGSLDSVTMPGDAEMMKFLIVIPLIFLLAFPAIAQDADSPAKRQLDFAFGLFQRNDYKAAAQEFQIYLSKPEWKERRDLAGFFLGECYRLQSLPTEAAKAYQDLLDSGATGDYAAKANYRLAKIRLDEGRGKDAIPLLLPLVEGLRQAEFREGVLYSLGAAYSQTGESKLAVDWWEKFRKEFPNSPNARRALLGQGMEEARIPDCEMAVTHLGEWLGGKEVAKDPAYPVALQEIARCEELLSKSEAAIGHYLTLSEAMKEEAPHDRALLSAAGIAFAQPTWKAFDQLIPRMRKELKIPASRLRWYIFEGNRYYRDKKWKEALESFGEASKLTATADLPPASGEQPLPIQLQVRQAWCAHALKDWKLSLGHLDQAIAAGGTGDEVAFLKGEAHKGLGQWQEAADWYAKVSGTSPHKVLALRSEAEACHHAGQWERGKTVVQQALAQTTKGPERVALLVRAGDCERELEHWASAAVSYASATVETISPEVREKTLFMEGWCRIRAEDYAGAAAPLEQMVTAFPNSGRMPEVLYLLGQAYGHTANTAMQIQKLEQLAMTFPTSDWSADGLMQLASTYAKEGNREGVLSSLLRYQNTFPDRKMQKDYAVWLADALVQGGSYETALITVKGLAKEPLSEEEQESLLYLTALCNERCKRHDQAYKEYQEVLTRFPKGSTGLKCHLGVARSAKALGNVAEASREVMVGFEILHNGGVEQPAVEAQLYLLQGDLEFDTGRFEQAYRAYARTSILYQHPEYTPRALSRSALCKEKLGDAQAAASLREQLKKDFPEYHEEGSGK